ncbi:TRAP transporter substrate-binding protein DctP [Candidatus Rariloculus sp.]|uniref:TRAP transporter substrate-binding protein DctP n=1 Tax=Candidatus Rariloculus sp. TaxID=3101265 RepID=UPI003D1041E4
MRIRSLPVSSLTLGVLLGMLLHSSGLSAQTVLRASHQWPGGIGDLRDEVVQMIARDAAAADVGLEIRVYPGESLFRARDQWPAMVRGRLDITALPLDYMSGRHPQFSATLMPGLVKDHDHAERLNDSPFMAEIRRIMDEEGVIVLADAWVAGGFVSTENCILWPDDIAGQVTRAAGPAFERMLVGAGASIASMPSSEIYTAMQTGVLDAANTSSTSFMSFRIHEQVECYTGPGDSAIWFMYEPIVMSKRSWEDLDAGQQAALRAASDRAEAFFAAEARKQDLQAEEIFEAAGVEVVHMSQEQIDAWIAIAERTSYGVFADEVEGGRALLDSALAVD